jgi:hypothetical protein
VGLGRLVAASARFTTIESFPNCPCAFIVHVHLMERNIQMQGNVVDYQLNIIPIDITVFASVPLTRSVAATIAYLTNSEK